MATFFKGVRQNDEVVVISVNATNGVVCSNGFSRPKDTNRYEKSNGSLPKYLQLLLALKTEPTMTTETAYKEAKKSFTATEKSGSINKSVPEGAYNEDVTFAKRDALYNRVAVERATVRKTNAEIAGLNKYIATKGTKTATATGPTKKEAQDEVNKALALGVFPDPKFLKKLGIEPKVAETPTATEPTAE